MDRKSIGKYICRFRIEKNKDRNNRETVALPEVWINFCPNTEGNKQI